jgi:hypothetical protein
MHLALIVVPNPPTRRWKHSASTQEVLHRRGLKDAALRVDQWDSQAIDNEPPSQIIRRDYSTDADSLDMLDSREP